LHNTENNLRRTTKSVIGKLIIYRDWNFHGGVDENLSFLGCNPMSTGEELPTFRRGLLQTLNFGKELFSETSVIIY